MINNLLNRILCIIWIHTYIRDFFVQYSFYTYKRQSFQKVLIRQCMCCNKIINKPNFK